MKPMNQYEEYLLKEYESLPSGYTNTKNLSEN